jgi:hypothetical protein
MSAVFADTWYYLALLNQDDAAHERVLQWSLDVKRPAVVTDFVLIEVGNAFSREPFRAKFVELARSLRADANTTVVPASRELVDKGLDLFARREDKEWSLTDCISFVVMRQHGLTEALTGDHHFEQAGFTIFLK